MQTFMVNAIVYVNAYDRDTARQFLIDSLDDMMQNSDDGVIVDHYVLHGDYRDEWEEFCYA